MMEIPSFSSLVSGRTAEPKSTLKGHSFIVTDIKCSAGASVFSCGFDQTVKQWDSSRVEPVKTFEGHYGFVRRIALDSVGLLIASASDDQTVRLWDVRMDQAIEVLHLPGKATSVAISPKGDKWLVATDSERQIHIWELADRKKIGEIKTSTDGITDIAFNSTGELLATGHHDQKVALHNVATRVEVALLPPRNGVVHSVAWHGKKNMLASGSCAIHIDDLDTRQETVLTIDRGREVVNDVAFRPITEQQIAGAYVDGAVRLWDLGKQAVVANFVGHTEEVKCLDFHPFGHLLVTGARSGGIKVWDVPHS